MTTSSDGYLTATADPTTASVLLSVSFAAAVPAPTVNLLANPSSELVSALAAATNCTTSRSTTYASTGTASTVLSSTAAGSMTARTKTSDRAPVSPGAAYAGSVKLRTGATARLASISLEWYTAAGAYISASAGGSANDSTTFATRAAFGTAPATAASAGILATVTSTGAGSELHYVDDMQIERTNLTAYVDGSVPGGAWSGAAHASMSYRPGYNKVTVKRADGTIVRGADGITAPSGAHSKLIDHEAPLGVAVVYTASATNGLNTITSTTATATITGQSSVAWLKSLRTPSLSVPVIVESWPDLALSIPGSVLPVLGGRYPNVSQGTRMAATGTLTVLTLTSAAQAALLALLNAGGPYLLQGTTASGEPDRYVSVGTVDMARFVKLAADPTRRFSLPLVEVARPSTAGSKVAYPGHTYADSKITWPLYSNRTGTYGSR